MRVCLLFLLVLAILSCNEDFVQQNPSVFTERSLSEFSTNWLAPYIDGQRYIFSDSLGEEASWEVSRAESFLQRCISTTFNDTTFLCRTEAVELTHTITSDILRITGQDQQVYIEGTGLNRWFYMEQTLEPDGYTIDYGFLSDAILPSDFQYSMGPSFPMLGSDTLRASLVEPVNTSGLAFIAITISQEGGWLRYSDEQGVNWQLDRIEP